MLFIDLTRMAVTWPKVSTSLWLANVTWLLTDHRVYDAVLADDHDVLALLSEDLDDFLSVVSGTFLPDPSTWSVTAAAGKYESLVKPRLT